MLIYRAIRKYGEDNFSIELIEDQINNQEVDNREKYWIDYYHSYIHSRTTNSIKSLSEKDIETNT